MTRTLLAILVALPAVAVGEVQRVSPTAVSVYSIADAEQIALDSGAPAGNIPGPLGSDKIGLWTEWDIGETLVGGVSIPRRDFRPEHHTLARWIHVDLDNSWPTCPLDAIDNGDAKMVVYPSANSPDYPDHIREFRSRRVTGSFTSASAWADSLAFVAPHPITAFITEQIFSRIIPGSFTFHGGGHLRFTFWSCDGASSGPATLVGFDSFETYWGTTMWEEQWESHSLFTTSAAVLTPMAFHSDVPFDAVLIDAVDGYPVRNLTVAAGTWLGGTVHPRDCEGHTVWPESMLVRDWLPGWVEGQPFPGWSERIHWVPGCTLRSAHEGDMWGPHPGPPAELEVWSEPMPADYVYMTEVLPEVDANLLIACGIAMLWAGVRCRG